MITHSDRLRFFVGILDPADYEFLRERNRELEKSFRRDRVRIFRKELKAVRATSVKIYRTRAANLAAAGRWNSYPKLVAETMLNFWSIQKLALAGRLFGYRLPSMINVAKTAKNVVQFMTTEAFAASRQTLPG